jgi:hypothetical protein
LRYKIHFQLAKGQYLPFIWMSFFFSRFRRFPEFHGLIEVIENIDKYESAITRGQERAFSEDFRRWARSQPPAFSSAIIRACDIGAAQGKFNREMNLECRFLAKNLEPLRAMEEEISKWREVSLAAGETYAKHKAQADKTEENLRRARIGGRPNDVAKAEAAHGAAQRKADNSLSSFNDQKESLNQREVPFRKKFLEGFVTPLLATVNCRFKTAEKMVALADEFRNSVEQIADFRDEAVDRFHGVLEELNKVVIE